MARTKYAPDEFDNPEGDRPAGAHRKVPRAWTRVATFVGVLVGSVGLAWGFAQLLLIADDVSWLNWLKPKPEVHQLPTLTPSPSETPVVVVTPSPTGSTSVSPSASPTSSH